MNAAEKKEATATKTACKIIPISNSYSPFRDHKCVEAIWCEHAQFCDNGEHCVDSRSTK